MAAHIGDDSLVHLVTTHAHAGGIGQAAQGQHRHLGGAPADIDHHRAHRLGYRHVGTNGGGHGLKDEIDLAGAGIAGGIANGAALDTGAARGHADDDFRIAEQALLAMHLADEMLDHFLGDFDVGDDAVAQGADGLDIVGSLAHHHLGVIAHRPHGLVAADGFNGHHGRLVEHDAAILNIDEGIGRAQIDGHVLGTELQESRQKRCHRKIRNLFRLFPRIREG